MYRTIDKCVRFLDPRASAENFPGGRPTEKDRKIAKKTEK